MFHPYPYVSFPYYRRLISRFCVVSLCVRFEFVLLSNLLKRILSIILRRFSRYFNFRANHDHWQCATQHLLNPHNPLKNWNIVKNRRRITDDNHVVLVLILTTQHLFDRTRIYYFGKTKTPRAGVASSWVLTALYITCAVRSRTTCEYIIYCTKPSVSSSGIKDKRLPIYPTNLHARSATMHWWRDGIWSFYRKSFFPSRNSLVYILCDTAPVSATEQSFTKAHLMYITRYIRKPRLLTRFVILFNRWVWLSLSARYSRKNVTFFLRDFILLPRCFVFF